MRIFLLAVLVSCNVYAQTAGHVHAYNAVALIQNQATVSQDFGKLVVLDASSLSEELNNGDFGKTNRLVCDEKFTGGQIVVETSRPGIIPDQRRAWVVIPKGLLPGTNVPLIRFVRYLDTGKDAEPPTMHIIPPGGGPSVPREDKEPVVDFAGATKIAERLYVLREQLVASVQQVSLATCATHCDPTALRKTRTDLLAFKKEMGDFSETLSSNYALLVAQKEWRERHGLDTSEVVKGENITANLQHEVENKDGKYTSWVEDQLIRRSVESNIGWNEPQRN